MIVLRSRLYEMQREERDSARSAERKGQVGSGDRSERIRTYNFPQGRVTDHRINLTLYKLDKVITGEALDELIEALITEQPGRAAGGDGDSPTDRGADHRRAVARLARCAGPARLRDARRSMPSC